MGGPGRGMMPGEKPKDFKNSIEKLVRYLGRYWYAIVAVMIFAAVSTVFSVAGCHDECSSPYDPPHFFIFLRERARLFSRLCVCGKE